MKARLWPDFFECKSGLCHALYLGLCAFFQRPKHAGAGKQQEGVQRNRGQISGKWRLDNGGIQVFKCSLAARGFPAVEIDRGKGPMIRKVYLDLHVINGVAVGDIFSLIVQLIQGIAKAFSGIRAGKGKGEGSK